MWSLRDSASLTLTSGMLSITSDASTFVKYLWCFQMKNKNLGKKKNLWVF